MTNKELEAKYGKENLFICAGTGANGKPFEIICVIPSRKVLSMIISEKDSDDILDLYVNNCAVGGDTDALNNADVFSGVANAIAETSKAATLEVKKYSSQ